ncbi:transmembrane protein, putative (macronuclear) [Tetrahymena thermophila SB210]|uniref:Transmembrane protein, putative n=1 Tax=Tetrahymena thermophila (strain SB210) TaxID=312017 RepID=I7MAP7_TETTS|nr:transmembrane protein, putative [Tetrahymena thermophila SB210]EAS05009.2 transmembrane protein, putative [Tetrahymena thermophila SB210]|eukprot:XP_001025254.2 transmembrane protein, putative [Tetrahymena thermophila SB210]
MQFKNAILILLVFVLLICSNPSSQVYAKSLKSQAQSTEQSSGCGMIGASCKSQRCCMGHCLFKRCVI